MLIKRAKYFVLASMLIFSFNLNATEEETLKLHINALRQGCVTYSFKNYKLGDLGIFIVCTKEEFNRRAK